MRGNGNRRLADAIDKLCILVAFIALGILGMFSLGWWKSLNYTVVTIVSLILFILEVVLMLVHQKLNKRQPEVEKLEEWFEYDKKRIRIEEKMEELSYQLQDYDISKYIDMNRLIFDGQSKMAGKKLVDYNAFLKRFGLGDEPLRVREDSAAFLGPFNGEGTLLYKQCRDILEKMDFNLQRSDNFVKKDDILMNIITLILCSELILVDVNGRNPNVYYELGIAHAAGKNTILLAKKGEKIMQEEKEGMSDEARALEFDIRQKNVIFYEKYEDLAQQLPAYVVQIQKRKANS